MVKQFINVIVISFVTIFATVTCGISLNFFGIHSPQQIPLPTPTPISTEQQKPHTGIFSTGAKMQLQRTAPKYSIGSFNLDSEARLLSARAQNFDPQVIKMGLQAYLKLRGQGLDPQQVLTIVDYSLPSTKPRLVVFDLKSNNVLFKELVAHGKKSGGNVPTSFSNSPQSLKSSLGVFLTGHTYSGHHGYSLKLHGLEKGFNDMAAARDIVVHAANYVNEAFAHAHGRLGASWGCFAVRPTVSSALINTIKDGTMIFAYYPDRNYLSKSSFLR